MRAELDATLVAVERAIAAGGAISLGMSTDPRVQAQAILSAMRSRASIIEPPINEGCWAILLDLYVHQANRPVSVSSAGIASGAPVTTGLRWIKLLIDAGLITRVPDGRDGRRIHLELTEAGIRAVLQYLAT